MKHCLIMTAYKDSEMIREFIAKVPKDWGIFVHLDKKADFPASEIPHRATVFQWRRIYWGAWEHLEVIVKLLDIASKKGYDYYHIVTGQDYFASSPTEFDKILKERKNHLGYFSIPNKDWAWDGGLKIFRYKTLSSFGDIRFGILQYLDKVFRAIQHPFVKKYIPSFNCYGGSVYCSLTNEAVSWLLSNSFSLKLLKTLKNTTCAEEVYFQTALMNSPFSKEISNDYLRYIDWHCNPAPRYLTESDASDILSSGCLFCRKVDSTISKNLLLILKEKIR